MSLAALSGRRYSETEFARGDIDKQNGLITAPNGAVFKQEGGILPQLLDRFFPEREEALAQGNAIAASAIKIAMNSFYGVLATPRCRFYSSETANAITQFGQVILRWTRDRVEDRGLRVLYGDTDSIFVESGSEDSKQAERSGRLLAAEITRDLNRHIEDHYGVDSHLELRFERIYRRFFLPGLRHSQEGSKKRYAGVIAENGEDRLVFTGLEFVRRDWTLLAKRFQHDLLEMALGRGDTPPPAEVEEMIRGFAGKLRRGELDDLLVYNKALRKDVEEYTKTTPPHVKAARILGKDTGRIISYIMTTQGPEPVQKLTAPPDYEHYVDKQIRPIAEAVLPYLDTSWEKIWSRQDELPLVPRRRINRGRE
jgi:DNA polymerase-2